MSQAPSLPLLILSATLLLSLAAGCGSDDTTVASSPAEPEQLPETLFVAHEGSLVSYDIASGEERPGAVQQVSTPTDMQALADGTLLVNLTDRNDVLLVDPETMLEISRVPSSESTAVRPVHSYISPEHSGKTYWMSLNDGTEGDPASNSACFLDVSAESPRYLQAVGEVSIGIGHHKATFSANRERVVISNIADCDRVLSVYDYSDITQIREVASLTAAAAGWDGASFAKVCDPTYVMGVPPAPHGCATSKLSGKAYCSLTGSGDIVHVDVDADPPTFGLLATTGKGAGYTKAHPGGQYIYSLQSEPREGAGGSACQIGQLAVVDALSDSVVAEVPLGYLGPDCTQQILGGDEETTEPAHSMISLDEQVLFITTAGGFDVADARVRQELVLDISDPAHPVQLPSIPVGSSTSYHGDTLSGDGKWLFIANNLDGTVTQVDVASLTVTRTLTVQARPGVLATFGAAEGPSIQTGPIH
jgi:hypothetical protein